MKQRWIVCLGIVLCSAVGVAAAHACDEHEKGKASSEAKAISIVPAAYAAVTAQSSTVTLQVEGMHCAACSEAIEKKVRGVAGVSACAVDHAKGTGTVTFDAAKTNADAILAVVRAAGFTAAIVR